MKKITTQRLVQVGLLTALSIVLSLWPKLPILPAVGWMKLEFSDVPILIGGFAFGPVYGGAIALCSALLEFFLTGETGWVGLVMNLCSTIIPVLIASAFYAHKKTRVRALVSLALFVLLQVLLMIPLNYFLGSLFFVGGETTVEAARAQVLSLMGWICLFNLIKSVANAVLIGLLYKSLSRTILSKELLSVPSDKLDARTLSRRRTAAVLYVIIGAVLAVLYLLLLVSFLFPNLLPFFTETFGDLGANLMGDANVLRMLLTVVLYALFGLLLAFMIVYNAILLRSTKK